MNTKLLSAFLMILIINKPYTTGHLFVLVTTFEYAFKFDATEWSFYMNSERLTQSDHEAFVLVNIIEEVVRAKVREAIKETDICKCVKCELNVCAIALNALPPKYVTTKKGHLLARIGLMNTEFQMDITIQVSKALKIVKERPLH